MYSQQDSPISILQGYSASVSFNSQHCQILDSVQTKGYQGFTRIPIENGPMLTPWQYWHMIAHTLSTSSLVQLITIFWDFKFSQSKPKHPKNVLLIKHH